MFAKTGKGAGAPRAKGASGLSIIGADVVITGDLTTDGNLHIDGEVKGDIRCASLTQGPASRISGNVIAGDARIAGQIDGTVTAKTLVIESSARVTGDLGYDSVSIDGGARVDGRFTHQDGSGDQTVKLLAAAE